MRRVSELQVTQYYLFPPRVIPYGYLMNQKVFNGIHELFAFRETSSFPGAGEVVFGRGVLEVEEGEIVVPRIAISDRRIIVTVLARSAAATSVFKRLREFIAPYDPTGRFAETKPVTVRQETECVAELDIGWSSLLSPVLGEFIENDVIPKLSDEEASVSLKSLNLRFDLAYDIKSDEIGRYGITLANKNFVVEPLVDTPLTDRRYFTSSPTSSDVHLKLIADLENALRLRR